MATLRDAQTSECIASGTPLEMVALADELGAAEVLFDDVGLSFDPPAVLTAHTENVKGLKAAATAASGDEKTSLQASHDAAVAEADKGRGQKVKAQKAMDAARARVK